MTCSRCGATTPSGQAIDSGHFLPEDAADETYAALLGFFKERG